MIILHGAFDGGFFIWGERSFSRAGLHNLRRMRRASADAVIDHVWDSGSGLIIDALAEAGYEHRGDAAGRKAEISLPTFAEKYPIPSSPLLGEIPAHHVKRSTLAMKRWYVETLPIDVAGMIDLMPVVAASDSISRDGCLMSRGVMVALDLYYILECCRFALSLLERGRFLPDIRRSDGPFGETRYESIWKPLFIGDDVERFGKLEEMTPLILSSAGRTGIENTEVVAEILHFVIDELIRSSWAGKLKNVSEANGSSPGRVAKRLIAIPDASMAEKKKRGKLVNALNPHALWARSLGWQGETEGLSQSLESIYSDVRGWWDRFEWFIKAPFKFCLEMSDAPDDNGMWRMDYSVKYLRTGEMIAAEDVWGWPEEYGGISGSYMRRYMLLLLGHLSDLAPAIMRSLDCLAPLHCALSMEEAADFLESQAARFTNLGIGVAYPAWWSGNTPDKLTIRGRLISGRVDPSAFDDSLAGGETAAVHEKDEILKFRWETALNGDILDEEELRIVRGPLPLVFMKGRWVFIHAARLEAVDAHLENLPSDLTAVEAVRLALRDSYVDGFADSPELEEIYDALKESRLPAAKEVPKGIRVTLRPYQERGYSWLSMLSRLGMGACLADDMGLGKTVQTLAMIQNRRDNGDRRPVLLVCPTSVLENWRLEIVRFFPRMTSYLHHGRTRARGAEFARNARRFSMVMTSYAILQRDVSSLQAVEWMGIVLDEAQNIKNPDTNQARVCRSLKAEWRVALTGTPIENHVGDLWSIMEFLMPGMLGSRRFFTNSYVKPIQKNRDPVLLDSLRKTVSPFIMRRMKTDSDIAPELPRKIETKVFCGLKKEQIQRYSDITSALGGELEGADGIRRKGIVLAALTRIKQVCDHPALVSKDDDFSSGRSAKLERMLALAEEMFEAGDKTLIFTQYVEMGNILKHQLQETFGREVLFMHGGLSKNARDGMVRRFQRESGTRFFVLSLKAGGVGLNLTAANHVVMYDRWWNPAVEAQAIDRAYRIGQKRNVHVHVFCCRGTLEERIDELLASKKEVASSVIDDGDNWVTELSDAELQRLLYLSPTAAEA